MHILQTLHKSDYESYKDAIDRPAEETCRWFLQHPLYLNWLNQPRSGLLWVTGDPGCGKTVLTSFLIDAVRASAAQINTPTAVCFFFCDEKIEHQNDGGSILSGILHQLFRYNSHLIRHARDSFETKNPQLVMKFKNLWDIFNASILDSEAGNIIVLVDALDECNPSSRTQFIRSLASHLSSRQSSNEYVFKVLITSRGHQSIEDTFESTLHVRLRAEDHLDQTAEDVARFIRLRTARIQTLTACSDEVMRGVEGQLIEKADGTFLWVSLVLDILDKTTDASPEAFNRILHSLPQELNGVYEAILNSSSEPDRLTKILHILIATRRPLTLTELNIALGMLPTDSITSWNNIKGRLQFRIARTLKSICGPFVRISNGTVYLVHQTAKEFLVRPSNIERPISSSWRQSLSVSQANKVLAGICSCYLLLDIFSAPGYANSRPDNDENADEACSDQPCSFLDYASKYWGYHFRLCDNAGSSDMVPRASRLSDTQSPCFHRWFPLYWTTISPDDKYPTDMTPLMITAHFGLRDTVSMLIMAGVDVNAKDSAGWTPLHWAVWEGHDFTLDGSEAVLQLLEGGANVQSEDWLGMTPLHWAAADRQEAIMRLLLAAGAYVDAMDSGGSTPLHLAVENGHDSAVELLLDHGADIDATCEVETVASSENGDIGADPDLYE